MQLIKKTINKQKINVRKVELKKSPEVILEFISNPNFKEEFLEFIEEVLNWSRPEKEEFREICREKKK
jgi:hypothetical protein